MLETAEAAENAPAILATPGVDGCLIGTNDLRISLGLTPEGSTGEALDPAAETAIDAILAACRATGAIPGIQIYGAGAATRRIAQGFRFVGVGTELRLARGAATDLLATIGSDA